METRTIEEIKQDHELEKRSLVNMWTRERDECSWSAAWKAYLAGLVCGIVLGYALCCIS